MKNLTRFAIAIAATATSVFAISCTRLEHQDDLSGGGKVFHASFETAGIPDTKTYIDSNHKMRWTEGDRISVFEGNTNNQQYRYTGQTGNTSADFEKVSSDSYSENKISSNYAVYPYLQDNKISKDEKLTVKLPSVQQYAEGSFGLGANTMVAVTNGTDNTFLSFKNLCGYLVIRLYGEGTVKRIFFKGNNGEKITGVATIAASYGQNPSVSMDQSASDEIILDCGSGVELGSTSSTATEFWFCIPPVEFSKGFSITVTNTAGGVMEKSLSSSRTISRNTINSMSALKAEFTEPAIPVPEMVDLGLPSGLKWASFNIGATKPEQYGGYYQWAGKQDVTGKNIYLDMEYGHCPYRGSTGGWTKYVSINTPESWEGTGSPDNKSALDPEDDIASATLGGKWRMPTSYEIRELESECYEETSTLNGVLGVKFTSKKNGNSIFLPAAGYRIYDELHAVRKWVFYWTSTDGNLHYAGYPDGFRFYASSPPNPGLIIYGRAEGRPVRPVYGDRVSVTGISISSTILNLKIGQDAMLDAEIAPSNAAEQRVSWSSSNTGVVTVNQRGYVKAINKGSATITVTTTDGGYTATCSVTVKSSEPEVPEMVDLGLSVKWASFNIGATKPEEYGGYYQWAGTKDFSNNGMNLYYDVCPYHIGISGNTGWTKYIPLYYSSYWSGTGSPDNKTVLDPEDDIAHVAFGGKWRMPTETEWTELMDNCNSEWTTLNGINGRKFTSKKNGNSIFLPAAGYRNGDLHYVGSTGFYWSSLLWSDEPAGASVFILDSDRCNRNLALRYQGKTVRPVYGDRVSVTEVGLNSTVINLKVGETSTLSAIVTPSNAAEKSVRWSIDNTSVATIDQSGKVTAVKAGSATITATTTDGGHTATCNVTVKDADPGVFVPEVPVPDAVDLGLSVKWASFNVGASRPVEYGGYYQWAGTEDVSNTSITLDWSNCPYHTDSNGKTGWTKYISSDASSYWSGSGNPDDKTVLDPEDDVAHVKLGGKWRMPTLSEWKELISGCYLEWVTLNGVYGMKFTSKKEGYSDKWIFLPAAGIRSGNDLKYAGSDVYYWSSSLLSGLPNFAYYLYDASGTVRTNYNYRYYGQSVRPVSE